MGRSEQKAHGDARALAILQAFLDGESQDDISGRYKLSLRTVSLCVARGRRLTGASKTPERRKRAADSWVRDQIATITREVGESGACKMLGIDGHGLQQLIAEGGTEDLDLDLAIQKAFYAVKAYQLDVSEADLSEIDRLSRRNSTERLSGGPGHDIDTERAIGTCVLYTPGHRQPYPMAP